MLTIFADENPGGVFVATRRQLKLVLFVHTHTAGKTKLAGQSSRVSFRRLELHPLSLLAFYPPGGG